MTTWSQKRLRKNTEIMRIMLVICGFYNVENLYNAGMRILITLSVKMAREVDMVMNSSSQWLRIRAGLTIM